jgi:hypothetical protein
MNRSFGLFVAASMAVTVSWLVAPAGAVPIASPSALQNAMPSSVEAVQYRRRYRNRGPGWVGPGIAGALIGGAIIGATRPYGYNAITATVPMAMTPVIIRATSPYLLMVAATSPIVCSASGPTTWRQAPISASTAGAMRARDVRARLGPAASGRSATEIDRCLPSASSAPADLGLCSAL